MQEPVCVKQRQLHHRLVTVYWVGWPFLPSIDQVNQQIGDKECPAGSEIEPEALVRQLELRLRILNENARTASFDYPTFSEHAFGDCVGRVYCNFGGKLLHLVRDPIRFRCPA